MPANAHTLENTSKHFTNAEVEARAEAEAAVMPRRERVKLKEPPHVKSDAAAHKYWKQTLKRAEDIDLLDDLDSDTLAIYCSQLSRWEALNAQRQQIEKSMAEEGYDMLRSKALAAISDELRKLENNLLSYAEKLGLTPSGRARLARKRAAAVSSATDPDADLFGD